MARKSKRGSSKTSSTDLGLPLPPWVYIINTIDSADTYAKSVSSLIPHSRVYSRGEVPLPDNLELEDKVIPICAYSTTATAAPAADLARDRQITALQRGHNLASVVLCNDSTFSAFSKVTPEKWPTNHVTMNVDGVSAEEVGKRIVRWLFTVLSVRETLHLIPECEMHAIDTKSHPGYAYCALKDAHNQRKDAKIQFVALIASKPEITEKNKLTWKVVDRSGEAKFYFHHRGPSSQYTWDWALGLKVGDRKVLPRMPMVARREPVAKKILLSPLRVTGATLKGASYLTIGLGRGVYWIGDQISLRRKKEDRFIPEAEYLEEMRKTGEEKARKQAKKRAKKDKKKNKSNVVKCNNEKATAPTTSPSDFKIFNEKGEKTWTELVVDGNDGLSTTTAAPSLLDEKVEKEFC